jgi:hypothetical protein
MHHSADKFVITNIRIYRQIADEAYEIMVQARDAGRRPKEDGTAGWILIYDPSRTSFKQAMTSIVFTMIWFEALIHVRIVQNHGEDTFAKYDKKKGPEDKLQLLGFTDEAIIECMRQLQSDRKALVYEKAYFDDNWTIAQDTAEKAHKVRVALHERFG